MGYGDELLAAGQAQRLYDADPQHRPIAIIDVAGKARWHPIWQGNPAITDTPSADTPRLLSAPNARPYLDPAHQPMTRESGWHFNRDFRARDHIAKIYLTEGEWQKGQMVLNDFGSFVLIEPYSKHPNLRWPRKHWEELVAARQDLTFIQHVHQYSRDYLIPGAVPVETLTFRDACGVLASADCYIRGESGMLHAAAALGVPAVAIWGECMDWDVLGGYPLEVGVGIRQPACGRFELCARCQQVMLDIPPEDVSNAIALATRWAGKVTLQ